MNKRVGLFVTALALTVAAVFSSAPVQAKPTCNIACLIGHACCSDTDCDAFCGGHFVGSCPGAGSGGGCCACAGQLS
jgi:hypothetical protein